MATWIRTNTSAIFAVSNDDHIGTSPLDNTTAPSDFDPAAVTSVKIEVTCRGSSFVNDLWSMTASNGGTLVNGATTLASCPYDTGTATILQNETHVASGTDTTPDTAQTVATWEGAEVANLAGFWTGYSKIKGPDNSVRDIIAGDIVVTITYTPSGVTIPQSMSGSVTPSGSLAAVKAVSFQKLRPVSDIATGSWTTAPLWSKIDEPVADDADFITSDLGSNAATSTCQLGLPAATDPKTYVGHRVRVRARQTAGTVVGSLRLSLTDGVNSVDAILSFTALNTWEDFDVYLNPRSLIGVAWDYSNLSITMYASPALLNSIQVDVSWLEVEIPPADPSSLSLADCYLPAGDPGPTVWDSKTWLVAVEAAHPDRLWLFSADAPTDGNNPAEWTCRRLAATPTNAGDTIASAAVAPDQTGTYLGAVCNGVANQGWYQRIGQTTWAANELVNSPGSGDYIAIGYRSNGNVVISAVGTDYVYGSVYDHDGTGIMAVNNLITANSGETWPFAAIQVGDRTHYLIRDGLGSTGQLALYTLRANNTINRGAVWTSSTVDVRATSAAGTVGGTVVAAFRRTDGTGIDAAVFTDGDSPTVTREQATTNDAQTAPYTFTPTAVDNNGTAFVLWLNDSPPGDDIYMAHRSGSWISNGEQIPVVSTNGWVALTGHIVAADTAGLLVSAPTGEIWYYEVSVATGVTFQQSVAGATTPAGIRAAVPKLTRTGAASPSGAARRRTSASYAGATQSAGSLARRIAAAFTGAAAAAGAVSLRELLTLAVAGLVAATGATIRKPRVARAGATAPVGAAKRRTGIATVGSATGSGARTAKTARTVGGVASPSGLVSRTFRLAAAGAATVFGAAVRRVATGHAGSAAPSGIAVGKVSKTIAGSAAAAGALIRSAAVGIVGQVTTAATVAVQRIAGLKQIAVAGTAAVSGKLVRRVATYHAGAASSSGTLSHTIRALLAGTMTTVGALRRKIGQSLAGQIAGSAALAIQKVAGLKQVAVDGAIAAAGAVSRRTARVLDGALTLTGSIARRPAKVAVSLLAPSGTLSRLARIARSGVVGPLGTVSKLVSRRFAGSLAAAAAISRTTIQRLSAALTPVGTVATSVVSGLKQIAVAGAIATVGAVRRLPRLNMVGIGTAAGQVGRKTTARIVGLVAATGAVSATRRLALTMVGAVVPTAALRKAVSGHLTGLSEAAGSVTRRITARYAGSVIPQATTVKRVTMRAVGLIVAAGTAAATIITSFWKPGPPPWTPGPPPWSHKPVSYDPVEADQPPPW